jgi:hypothetical protein
MGSLQPASSNPVSVAGSNVVNCSLPSQIYDEANNAGVYLLGELQNGWLNANCAQARYSDSPFAPTHVSNNT